MAFFVFVPFKDRVRCGTPSIHGTPFSGLKIGVNYQPLNQVPGRSILQVGGSRLGFGAHAAGTGNGSAQGSR